MRKMTKAICDLSVIPLRREPSDKSEMTSQILFGEIVDVLEEREKWLMVKALHDNYEGWVARKQLSILESANHVTPPAVVNTLLTFARDEAANLVVLPAGTFLHDFSGNRFRAGQASFTLKTDLAAKDSASVIGFAEMFISTPYLWGGRTFMGIDCSGFTQVVMRLCQKNIPRDAYQQAETGEVVSFIEEAQTGDLAFFDNAEGRITHVGIVSANNGEPKRIIHASGKVRTDVLDHQGIFNQEINGYSHNLRIIKRIL
jgi:hypothetical protein